MCYYNGQKVSHVEWIKLKQLEKLVRDYKFLDNDYENADGLKYQKVAVLKRKEGVEDFDVVEMEWGFMPKYWKNREEATKNRYGFKNEKGEFIQYLTLNAKSEELLFPNKMYRDATLHRRCLILSGGFVEAHHYFGTHKKTGAPLKTPSRQPYKIGVKDKPIFYFAGIWEPWTDQTTGEYVETVSLVTTKAIGHSMMEQIHNTKFRMPTILNDELAWEWMFGNLTEERITEIAKTQFPSDQMEACEIEKGYKVSSNPFVPFKHEGSPVLEF
jgi:putative SOS response-associated peptidase YedK